MNAGPSGQKSFTLPVVQEFVAPPQPDAARAAIWARPLDAIGGRLTKHDVLAVADSTIVFPSGGHMCGFRARDGRMLWCDRPGLDPASAADEIAYAAFPKSIRSVDALTGVLRWKTESAEPALGAGNGFLIRSASASRDASEENYSERDAAGKVLWTTVIPQTMGNSRSFVRDHYAFVPVIGDGAYLSSDQVVLRLGKDGGLLSQVGAWDIYDVRPPLMIYKPETFEEVEDHFITFDVEIATFAGAVGARYHFEPDYDANVALLNDGEGHAEPIVRVEGSDVFAEILHHKLYRYQLRDAAFQRPLLIESGADFLGGPYVGWLFVQREDGVWALRPERNRIRSRFMVRTAASAEHLWAERGTVYVATADGRVVGVDASRGKVTFDTKPCRRPARVQGVATSVDRIFVACLDARGRGRVAAYLR